MEAERRISAMGCDAHLVVVAPDGADAAEIARRATGRIAELERLWSRFIPDSDVSRLNRAGGRRVEVAPDTVILVAHSIDAYELSGGLMDVTLLEDVIAAGYDRPFDQIPARLADRCVTPLPRLFGPCDIAVGEHTVQLPPGVGFDPGGIGKGLAADLVAHDCLTWGATGALVSIGGDVSVIGDSPTGAGWTIGVRHPWSEREIARVGLWSGAVASSTTLKRHWTRGERQMHHLIDPVTRAPSTSPIRFATAIADTCWRAEVAAKVALLSGAHPEIEDADTLTVDRAGRIHTTPGFESFAGTTVRRRIERTPTLRSSVDDTEVAS